MTTTEPINQIPLWCRVCSATFDSFDEDGVCAECGTPNVLSDWTINVSVPSITGYSLEEVFARFIVEFREDPSKFIEHIRIERK